MFKKLRFYVSRSINLKITIVTTICLVIFLGTILGVIYSGMNQLKEQALTVSSIELDKLLDEYYVNYIDSISDNIDNRVDGIFDEIHILSTIMQNIFSNKSNLQPIIDILNDNEYFIDRLTPYGNYYQNLPDEQTAVFVASYMIDEYGIIKSDAEELIANTQLMDLIMPAFTEYGVNKVQAYYQGGQNKEIFRLSPWTNIGVDIVDIYPEIFDTPIWDTFNPGLAEEWQEWISELGSINEITSLLRVTKPVQDGLTGRMVLTFSQPITNEDMTEFEGTVSYDVPINHLISYIEDISIADSGFAFMTQGDDNVFAINEKGIEIFGLGNDEESTVDSDQGFNWLNRFFVDSAYESVQNIQLNKTEVPEFDSIEIEGKEYILISKRLLDYQTWSPDRSFYDESWVIGFVVPYDEVYNMYITLEKDISAEMDALNFQAVAITMILMIVILFFIYKFNTIITSELTQLSYIVKEAKEKNYDIDFDIESSDEVGILAQSFKSLLTDINSSFKQLEEQNDTLKTEIENRRNKDRIIDYLEHFDPSTDLPNKKALMNILSEMKNETDDNISLVVVGLDDFRKINEAYSWTFGDKLMMAIGNRLREHLPNETLLFKLSGDEFAFIVKDRRFKELIAIIEEINSAFKKPYSIENLEVTISSSIGVSSFPVDSSNPLDIFKFATNAMIHAKENNKGRYEFYNEEINTTARLRMEMISELRNAIETDEFFLTYQPIISLENDKIKGVEALLRWNNKNLGSVPPNVFIPLAEKTHLILSIGEWVLERALTEMKILHQEGHKINIAINVSIMQFLDIHFINKLNRIISKIDFDPTYITIEITEGLFINDLETILNVLNQLKRKGMAISVDDFGTGFSSLSYIKNLPLSKLKIDRAFINEIHEDKSYKLVSGIIGLAKSLNLTLVAEGIETKEQLDIIKEKACEEAQGFYYSKPLSLDDLREFIKKN